MMLIQNSHNNIIIIYCLRCQFHKMIYDTSQGEKKCDEFPLIKQFIISVQMISHYIVAIIIST